MGMTIREQMLMVNKEATAKKDKDSQPRRYSVQPRKIAEQAAAVKGKMNGAYCAAL